ncbi:MAG: butyrate kinase [Spirochaetaceae bacterium]|nr:MAG: butyrate kinase [Spirochaetaceae bacterium]
MRGKTETHTILVINPGSTSTKIALYEDEREVLEKTLHHSAADLDGYDRITDQYDLRKKAVLETLSEGGYRIQELSAVVGRGGLIHPVQGGTYAVNEQMLEDLRVGVLGEHASNLGGILAWTIAAEGGIPAFIVDPVVVDELEDPARYTGIPSIPRRSIFHALNQKAVARRAAARRGGTYEDYNFIVVHLGGGITVGAHRRGRVIDVNDGLNGEGPFTPERSGAVPALPLAKLCFSGRYRQEEIGKMIKGGGGLVAHLGTNDGREVARRIEAGDERARVVFHAMAYQVSKEVGAMAAVLGGQVDGVLLTGGLAWNEQFCRWVEERVSFIAPVERHPGEGEMVALAEGALRVLTGIDEPREYRPGESR